MKLVAPDYVDHFNFDNVDYRRDEHGHFEIRHPEHLAMAIRHGAVPFVEGEDPVFDARPLPVRLPGADEELAAKDAEIAELKAKLAAASAGAVTGAQDASEGTSAPAGGADASGDTSGSTGDTPAPVDVDALDRDGLVAILKERGVAVPGNISKADALALVKGE